MNNIKRKKAVLMIWKYKTIINCPNGNKVSRRYSHVHLGGQGQEPERPDTWKSN